jgi:hypothetical protein
VDYGPKVDGASSAFWGWIVTATCGVEPTHYHSREEAFEAAGPFVLQKMDERRTLLYNELEHVRRLFNPILVKAGRDQW